MIHGDTMLCPGQWNCHIQTYSLCKGIWVTMGHPNLQGVPGIVLLTLGIFGLERAGCGSSYGILCVVNAVLEADVGQTVKPKIRIKTRIKTVTSKSVKCDRPRWDDLKLQGPALARWTLPKAPAPQGQSFW